MTDAQFRIFEVAIIIITSFIVPSVREWFAGEKQDASDSATLLQVKSDLKGHLADCNLVPKTVLLEKIDNLVKLHQEDVLNTREFQRDIREELRIQRERTDTLSDFLNKVFNSGPIRTA